MNALIVVVIVVAALVLVPLALAVRIMPFVITVVFPAPLMSTIEELVAFLTRENNAAHGRKAPGISRPNGLAAPAALR